MDLPERGLLFIIVSPVTDKKVEPKREGKKKKMTMMMMRKKEKKVERGEEGRRDEKVFVYKPRVEVWIPERSRGRYTFSRYGDPSYSHVDRALSTPRSPPGVRSPMRTSISSVKSSTLELLGLLRKFLNRISYASFPRTLTSNFETFFHKENNVSLVLILDVLVSITDSEYFVGIF